MLGLTRRTDYALVAIAALADAKGGKAHSARQVADAYGLPVPQTMNVLKDLQRAGIVTSTRGLHGGYRLADAVEKIMLLRVIEAIEGPVRMALCCGDDEGEGEEPCVSCGTISTCPVTTGTRRLNERIVGMLATVSIRDLMEPHVDVPVEAVMARQ